MRSILALALAALVLAAQAPAFFTETPVCGAVDGVDAVACPHMGKARTASFFPWHKSKRRPESPSCCGTPDCPMHAHGCGKTAACTMDAAYGPEAKIASAGPRSHDVPRLCAPSCGREGAKVMHGVPDPGTFEPDGRPAPLLAGSRHVHRVRDAIMSRSSDPAVPPPRS